MNSDTSERAMVNLSFTWSPKAAELCLAALGCRVIRIFGVMRCFD
jgi:hypothetical protein